MYLEGLRNDYGELAQVLSSENAGQGQEKIDLDEKTFRWMQNQTEKATEKLAQGIRGFAIDQVKLEELVKPKL